MLNRIFKIRLLYTVFLLTMLVFISCEKEKETIGVIIVKNVSGETISGAVVTLHQDGQISPQGNSTSTDIKRTEETDANGRVSFTYELPAILNVEVTKVDGNDTFYGYDIIRLLKGQTTTKIIEIN